MRNYPLNWRICRYNAGILPANGSDSDRIDYQGLWRGLILIPSYLSQYEVSAERNKLNKNLFPV